MPAQIHDENPTRLELIKPVQRYLVVASRRDDPIVWCSWCIPTQPIAGVHGNPLACHLVEDGLCTAGQSIVDFHSEDVVRITDDVCQERRVVTRPRPDFQ